MVFVAMYLFEYDQRAYDSMAKYRSVNDAENTTETIVSYKTIGSQFTTKYDQTY